MALATMLWLLSGLNSPSLLLREELVNWGAIRDPEGAACRVDDFSSRVDAERMVNRGGKVGGGDGIGGGVGAEFIARSIGRTTLNAAAGQDCRVTERPMLAARVLHSRRAAEFTHPQY